MTHDRNSDLAVLEAMGQHFFPTPELTAAANAVSEITRNVAVRQDADEPWGEGNRAKCHAVMLTGLTRHGKTELAQQVANGLEDVQTVDGQVIRPRPIYVECPSVFSNGLLFNSILKAMMGGQDTKRPLPVAMAYNRVDTQLPIHRPTLIILDEFQYAFAPSGVSAARSSEVAISTLGFVRHLLDHVAWPVPILLMGLPDLARRMNEPDHAFLNEKITPVHIAPMVQGSPGEIERLKTAVKSYCADAGIDNAITGDDFYKRLIHATDHARGLAFELCQASVMRAWYDGRRPVAESDFAARYRLATNAVDDQNPFIIGSWHTTDRTRLMQETLSMGLASWKAANR